MQFVRYHTRIWSTSYDLPIRMQIADVSGAFGLPIATCLTIGKWAIESLDAAKANIKVTQLLKARVSSLGSILNSIKSILEKATYVM